MRLPRARRSGYLVATFCPSLKPHPCVASEHQPTKNKLHSPSPQPRQSSPLHLRLSVEKTSVQIVSSFRTAMERRLKKAGYAVATYASADHLLRQRVIAVRWF